MEGDSEHMLKWNSHDEFLVDVFKNYRKSNKFTNVTLLAQGKFFEAHQCILASCSEYMQAILTHTSVEYQKHPIIVVDILPHFMSALLDYMYIGIVKIASNELTDFLAAAQKLKVQGLFVTVENLLRDAQIAQNAQNVQNAHNLRNLNSGALELAQMHTEYAIDRFSQQKCLPFVNQIRTFTENNCSNLRSPPTKRKRCLDSLDGGRRMVNTDSIPNVIQPIFNENSPVLNPALLNGPILPMHEHASLPTAPNDANEPTDFNPMPLVKVEMEDDAEANALEEGAVNTNGGESTLDMEEKKVPLVPEEHPTAPDDVSMPPLTVPGSDGEAIGSSVQDYLHSELHNSASDGNNSDDAEPALVMAMLPDSPLVLSVAPPDLDLQDTAFRCKECGATLANSNLLRRHTEDMHQQIRKHLCILCRKTFKRKEHLERHNRIHTGVKPFKCTICDSKFTQKEHLKGHIDNVHLRKKQQRKSAGNKSRTGSLSPDQVAAVQGLLMAVDQKTLLVPTAAAVAVNGGGVCNLNAMVLPTGEGFNRDVTSGGLGSVMDTTSPAGLLGRMVGSGLSSNSIGSAMTSNLTQALTTMMASGPQQRDEDNENSSGEEPSIASLVSSRTTSPPSLTSPSQLLNSCQIPASSAAYPGSILSARSLANILTIPGAAAHSSPAQTYMAFSSQMSNIDASLTSASSTLNAVFTPRLASSVFSTQQQSNDISPTRTFSLSTASGSRAGRGGARGRGCARRGNKAIRGAGRPRLVTEPRRAEDDTSNLLAFGGGGAATVSSPTADDPSEGGSQQLTAVYAPVSRNSVSSPEKHIKKVLLNFNLPSSSSSSML